MNKQCKTHVTEVVKFLDLALLKCFPTPPKKKHYRYGEYLFLLGIRNTVNDCVHYVMPNDVMEFTDNLIAREDVADGYTLHSVPYDEFTLSWSAPVASGIDHKVLVTCAAQPDGVLLSMLMYASEFWTVGPYIAKIPYGQNIPLTHATVVPMSQYHKIFPPFFDPNAYTKNSAEYEAMFMPYFRCAIEVLMVLELPNIQSQDEPFIDPNYIANLINPGRTRTEQPFVEYKTLKVVKPRVIAAPLPGTGSSGHKQKWHTRCGHVRRLRSGRVIQIHEYEAGDPKLGRIYKDYEIRPL